MRAPESAPFAATCPVAHGSPLDSDGPRVQLHSPEFALDPHAAYRAMRERFGSLAPVELAPGVPATLVLGYRTALQVLNDPEHFPADPRRWQQDVPADCPVLPIMEWRPTGSRNAGQEFARYRQATIASIEAVDLYGMHAIVEQIAQPLIDSFRADGEADLLSQYAFPLTFQVCCALVGCPPEIGQQVATGMAAMFEGTNAEQGNRMVNDAMRALVALKRTEPGNDVASMLLAHPAELDEEELVHQLVTFYGAGIELQLNLIVNTLLLIITEDRFGGTVLGGSMSTRDALDEVLFTDPPLANYCITYPRQPILLDDVWLPAHQPVLVSMAACNNDPAIRADDRTGNRSHLAFGIGQHACPARSLAYLIAQDAIDQLLDMLPDMRPALPGGEPTWRPGPFHRALAALPVTW
ncbi:cytochrome P450 [Nocardia blacklockiae]|uniref:cytochrome P450 n=1 Tax=Nocardia blacklockiae TaxID=480036 RepID=UPI00189620B0|nr:cytochrome P450 [Nocardia blacklockiae]MBF6174901.1 cytochrome P450 [Nocardia blacklockiae]